MKRLIKKILKEDLTGQEFSDNFYEEQSRFLKSKDRIVEFLKSEYNNIFDIEFSKRYVVLGSLENLSNRNFEAIIVTIKFKKVENNNHSVIKNDIKNVFKYYFDFDTDKYGAPIRLEFKQMAWVIF
jgi:hypothetical protein